jgi:glucoamylase
VRLRYQHIARGITSATHDTTVGAGDPAAVAPYMCSAMQRNVATDGWVFVDPVDHNRFSARGCVIASPSYAEYPGDISPITQDYVFNWTRDAAITVSEVVSAVPALVPTAIAAQTITDYVRFARTSQLNGTPVARGSCLIDGGARDWSDQADGPALRVCTVLRGYPLLDDATKAVAREVVNADLAWMLGDDAYKATTTTHWEDSTGYSLFARATQLRCFNNILTNSLGIDVPAGTSSAAIWLESSIAEHFDETMGCYRSVLERHMNDGSTPAYDPSIDPIMACLYGDGIACTDPQLLMTAAALREQWTSRDATPYPVNDADASRGSGPLIGRYVGDGYDGDTTENHVGHPWVVCTCNLAELYYRLAATLDAGTSVPSGSLVEPFFGQLGVDANTASSAVILALRTAADRMLNAVIFHSDHLELSEQFDQTTGYEKSVVNLTWSYAAFLSALRARAANAN